MLQSHQGYQKMFMAGPRFSNCFIADLSQNPQSHNINSSFMPTQITHSTLYSFSRQCIFTPSELMFAHGWPCIKDVCDQYDSMPFKLDQLSARQQVHLSGNAMHLPMLAMFYLFVLSNCIRRDSMDVFDKWHLVARSQSRTPRSSLTARSPCSRTSDGTMLAHAIAFGQLAVGSPRQPA